MNFKTDLHICPYAATVSYRKDKSLKDFLVRATVTIPAQIWNSLEYNGASPQSVTRLQDKQKKKITGCQATSSQRLLFFALNAKQSHMHEWQQKSRLKFVASCLPSFLHPEYSTREKLPATLSIHLFVSGNSLARKAALQTQLKFVC